MAALSVTPLCAAAFALGARHALDADHLVVIDGIARRNIAIRPAIARLGGLLFSLGHVMLVALVAIAAALLAPVDSAPPRWLGPTGILISGTVLAVLGMLNLRAALTAEAGAHLSPIGLKARLAGPGDTPLAIVATGAAFAISFDTVTIALGLGFAGEYYGSTAAVGAMSLCFGLGMTLIGSANGVWIVYLLRTANQHAAAASQILTGTIGLLNLMLAAMAFASLFSGAFDRWRGDHGLLLSLAAVGLCCLAAMLGSRFTASRATPSVTSSFARPQSFPFDGETHVPDQDALRRHPADIPRSSLRA